MNNIFITDLYKKHTHTHTPKHKDKNKNTSVFYVQNNMHTLPDLSEHAFLSRLSKS